MKPLTSLRPLVLVIITATTMSLPVTAATMSDSDWQPISSEKLIRLPANYMDKSLQQNFRESKLSGSISALEEQIRLEAQRINNLREGVATADGEQRIDRQHQLLIAKSNYLDLMQEKLQLDRKALETRSRVYSSLMQKLRLDKRKAQDPVTARLLEQQHTARQRLQHSVDAVDELMTPLTGVKQSHYQTQYANNLGKIEELKVAIQHHAANAAPMVDGEAVTREDFVRHMLAATEAERAVMDQETLMLNYMAKLVALDAQALEHQLIAGDVETGQVQDDPARVPNAVDWFVN